MDLAAARGRLNVERQRLTDVRDAAGSLTGTQDGGDAVVSAPEQHGAEQAAGAIERELDSTVVQRAEAELDDVQVALSKLEGGTYGLCEVCKNPISDARLEAMPAARYCIDDQARVEREPWLRDA